jgi:hypothetical protein
MVGMFLTVWVRNEIREDVKVSCVGRGLMGCLGNKVNISYCNILVITNM